MRVKLILLLVALFGLVLGPGSSAQKRAPDPCQDPQSTVEQKQCARQEFDKADAELNRAYQQLTGKLEDAEEKEKLKTAQQAWLKFRDAECDFESFQNRGGTIYGLIYVSCQTSLTIERAKGLREVSETH